MNRPGHSARLPAAGGHGLWIDEVEQGDDLVLEVAGELDLGSAPALQARIDECRARGRPVKLDLSRLSFIDAAGLRVLVDAKEPPPPGKARVYIRPNVAAVVQRALEMSRLETIVNSCHPGNAYG